MRVRAMSRIAWSLGAVAVAFILAGALTQLLTPQGQLPSGLRSSPTEILDSLTNLGLPIIGALIASRRPRNPLGWILILAGLGLGVSTFGGAYAAYSLLIEPELLPAPYAFAWVSNWSWTLGVGLLPFLLLLFPTGGLEALQNVAKYAAAARVTVRLAASNGELRFEVIDDGRGFDPASTGHGTGLQGMADRVEALGAMLAVRSSPGAGTTVAGSVPAGPRENER
jgi:hypothetical protein